MQRWLRRETTVELFNGTVELSLERDKKDPGEPVFNIHFRRGGNARAEESTFQFDPDSAQVTVPLQASDLQSIRELLDEAEGELSGILRMPAHGEKSNAAVKI